MEEELHLNHRQEPAAPPSSQIFRHPAQVCFPRRQILMLMFLNICCWWLIFTFSGFKSFSFLQFESAHWCMAAFFLVQKNLPRMINGFLWDTELRQIINRLHRTVKQLASPQKETFSCHKHLSLHIRLTYRSYCWSVWKKNFKYSYFSWFHC